MINCKFLPFVLIMFTNSTFINAQDTLKNQKPYFKFSTNYLTNSVYNGRKDSIMLPLITPSIGYYNNGFFSLASVSYSLAKGNSRFDHVSIEAGYDFNINGNLNAGFYGSKYFYNSSSTDIISEMKGGLGANFCYESALLTALVGADLSFSSKSDIEVSGSIAHYFSLGDKGAEWNITPTLGTHIGTQNYYHDYIRFRKTKGGIRGRGKGHNNQGTTTTVTKSASKFGILDFEFSIPISYDGNNWGLFFTPAYSFPQNPVKVSSSPTSSIYISEKLENTFYSIVGIYIKF